MKVAVVRDVEHKHPWCAGMEKYLPAGHLVLVSEAWDGSSRSLEVDGGQPSCGRWMVNRDSIEILGDL